MQDPIVVNKIFAIAVGLGFLALAVITTYFLFGNWIKHNLYSKRMRRRAHLRYVENTLTELRYKIINLTLACERGDLSLVAYNRRVLNTAVLIRRYETKLGHLNRLIR